MTLTFKHDVHGVMMNEQAKYVSRRSFGSEVIVRMERHADTQTHTHTHTHTQTHTGLPEPCHEFLCVLLVV